MAHKTVHFNELLIFDVHFVLVLWLGVNPIWSQQRRRDLLVANGQQDNRGHGNQRLLSGQRSHDGSRTDNRFVSLECESEIKSNQIEVIT